ncbi:biopolymer transporter ExbD [Microbulbifer sp. CAU 1566]|uniref:ExbD/TolR family protein n=1 Tax=Microbulbifer sp. CAU 1566 TaxID=2933269 RepID=UPI0020053C59|nr:biopolymer transporter ExbD [Microbulbifer sp. CAU 1566]MCK7596078.1 biopolymer transporter ExbD [Microbulbifer sp. CAU 1566]
MKRESRRMKRMARSRKRKTPGMNLTSLMDVFTILVFFLLTNSSSNEAIEAPKVITLPDSVVESKPRETVTLMVTHEEVLIEAKPVMKTEDLFLSEELVIEAIQRAMIEEVGKAVTMAETELEEAKLALAERAAAGEDVSAALEELLAEPPEVNILADRTVPFNVLKKVMSSCTNAGYTRISLAVIQKASQS